MELRNRPKINFFQLPKHILDLILDIMKKGIFDIGDGARIHDHEFFLYRMYDINYNTWNELSSNDKSVLLQYFGVIQDNIYDKRNVCSYFTFF